MTSSQLQLVLGTARRSGVDTTLLDVVHEHLTRSIDAGRGDDDVAAVVRTYDAT